VTDVKLLARWDGWCDPCETERPLVLTETGQRGLRAWMRGVGHEDRELTLTCGVCGEWQAVGHDDEDDVLDAFAPLAPVAAVHRLGARQLVVRTPAFSPYPVAVVLPAQPRSYDVSAPATLPDSALELLAEGLDLISLGR
jgi:hypothetical protein